MLRLAGISHSYQRTDTFTGLSFALARGQIGCLLGPSGCGKTTALRCIAGFEAVSAGAIHVNGRLVSSRD